LKWPEPWADADETYANPTDSSTDDETRLSLFQTTPERFADPEDPTKFVQKVTDGTGF